MWRCATVGCDSVKIWNVWLFLSKWYKNLIFILNIQPITNISRFFFVLTTYVRHLQSINQPTNPIYWQISSNIAATIAPPSLHCIIPKISNRRLQCKDGRSSAYNVRRRSVENRTSTSTCGCIPASGHSNVTCVWNGLPRSPR